MKPRRVVLREIAERDVDAAIEHYLTEAGVAVAVRFIDAMETAVHHISLHPLSGSPRYATEIDIPDLRTWTLKGFPYLVFYVVNSQVDIWRVLHGQRDIPEWLQDR